MVQRRLELRLEGRKVSVTEREKRILTLTLFLAFYVCVQRKLVPFLLPSRQNIQPANYRAEMIVVSKLIVNVAALAVFYAFGF